MSRTMKTIQNRIQNRIQSRIEGNCKFWVAASQGIVQDIGFWRLLLLTPFLILIIELSAWHRSLIVVVVVGSIAVNGFDRDEILFVLCKLCHHLNSPRDEPGIECVICIGSHPHFRSSITLLPPPPPTRTSRSPCGNCFIAHDLWSWTTLLPFIIGIHLIAILTHFLIWLFFILLLF